MPEISPAEIIRRFADRAEFRKLVQAKTVTETESVVGTSLTEYLFGPHHRNLAAIGLHAIVVSPDSGYSAMPLPAEFAKQFSNLYKHAEVEPGKFQQVLHEGVLLLYTAGFAPVVVELKRVEKGLWLRVFTRSEQAELGRQLVEGVKYYCQEKNTLRGRKIDPQGRFLKIGKCSWDDLVVPEEIKQYLQNDVAGFVQKLEQYRKFGLKTKRGILLSGSPGTGKTLSARVLANEVDCTLIWVTPRDLADPGKVRDIYRMARDLAPSIVLFEDADLYALDRQSGNRSAIMGELFNTLDGLEELEDVLTVMTTNHPEQLERALVDRPGRFDNEIEFPLPDRNLALLMVKRFTQRYELTKFDNQTWDAIGNILAGLSGSHIYEVVKRATIRAIDSRMVQANRLQVPLSFILDAARDVRDKHEANSKRFELVDIPDAPAPVLRSASRSESEG